MISINRIFPVWSMAVTGMLFKWINRIKKLLYAVVVVMIVVSGFMVFKSTMYGLYEVKAQGKEEKVQWLIHSKRSHSSDADVLPPKTTKNLHHRRKHSDSYYRHYVSSTVDGTPYKMQLETEDEPPYEVGDVVNILYNPKNVKSVVPADTWLLWHSAVKTMFYTLLIFLVTFYGSRWLKSRVGSGVSL